MTGYILQLVLMLALVAGMAVASLWLWRRVQPGMAPGRRERAVSVIDAVPMGTMGRLAVVEFEGRRYLIGVSRGRMDLLAEGAAAAPGDRDGGVRAR